MAAKAKVNQHERQARWSVILAAVGGLGTLGAAAFTLQAFRLESFEIPYNPKGMRMLLIMGGIAVAGAAATAGFFLGLNSAGQKRNKLSRMSWTGFAANAIVITLALSVFVFFWLAKEPVG